jgi:hypothetical protein
LAAFIFDAITSDAKAMDKLLIAAMLMLVGSLDALADDQVALAPALPQLSPSIIHQGCGRGAITGQGVDESG